MQLERSGVLLASAAAAVVSSIGMTALSWGTAQADLPGVALAIICWAAGFVFLAVLGGNLFFADVGKLGLPRIDPNGHSWSSLLILAGPTALVVLAYQDPAALRGVEVLLVIIALIRLIQWNIIEPNGLEEFRPT